MISSSFSVRNVAVLLLGIGIGVALTLALNKMPAASHAPLAIKSEPKVLYWYDPMEPAQHFDKPGKSPFMDMELVPKYAAAGTSAGVVVAGAVDESVVVDSAMVQNLGMRTAKVVRSAVGAQREFSGMLMFNERNQAVVQLRAGGFVEKAWPLAPGDRVTAGQPLATFYVPEWLNAQNELLATIATNNPRLTQTLRTRLQLLGVPENLIDQVARTRKPQTRITISAPITGIIESLDIKTGMSLGSGETLARITNIDSLWLDVAIPESEAAGLHVGDAAVFYPTTSNATPLKGKVESILPSVSASTRTATARIVVSNPNHLLKPGASGRVVLQTSESAAELLVPTEAVIRTGKRNLVMVADAANHFRPVVVTTGSEVGSQTVINGGLEEGQNVVVSGQFLLDSEALLLGLEAEPPMEMTP